MKYLADTLNAARATNTARERVRKWATMLHGTHEAAMSRIHFDILHSDEYEAGWDKLSQGKAIAMALAYEKEYHDRPDA